MTDNTRSQEGRDQNQSQHGNQDPDQGNGSRNAQIQDTGTTGAQADPQADDPDSTTRSGAGSTGDRSDS